MPPRGPRVIAADRVIGPARDFTPGVVEIEDGRVVRVRSGRARRADLAIRNGILAPGLIDLQVNGAAGVDFLFCERASDVNRAHRYLLSTGVTGYLATFVSAPLVRVRAALVNWQRLAAAARAPRVLGVHLEGPYLNPSFAGAHDLADLRPPNLGEFETLLDMVPGLVKVVTLAPELPGAGRLIRAARDRKIVVAAGHTAATFEEAQGAFASGVSLVTHLFNAMRPLHHRYPGIVAAALSDPAVFVSIIADLVHLHPATLSLVVRMKGWQHVALVTDAVAAAGSKKKTSRLSGRALMVSDAPRLPDGTLAGSALGLDQAVRNLVSVGVPVREAILMASAVPAALLRRRDVGRIAPGTRADLAVFDRGLKVRAVYVDGQQVYKK